MNNQYKIIININKGYDKRGRKIVVNLSDGRDVTDMEKFFNADKAVRYIHSLMSQGYEIESVYSIKNYESLTKRS